MGSFNRFKTVSGADAGYTFELKGLDGKPSGEKITILGVDSKVRTQAEVAMRKRAIEFLDKNGVDSRNSQEYLEFTSEEALKLSACLINSWTFEEPCTPANVLDLLANAPHIREQVDLQAGKREQFVRL